MNNDFAAIILSHGRPDKVYTYETLKKCGYTGRVVVLIDDMDKTREQYIKNFGDQVYVFDKKKIKAKTDPGNNFNDYRSTIYPRNAMFDVAKELGLKNFIQLDDDYTDFRFRFDKNLDFLSGGAKIRNLNKIFSHMVNYLESTNLLTLCMAQGGDFIGGQNSGLGKKIKTKRKAMNSFVCSTARPFYFFGQLNEDVNMAIVLGSQGNLILTINNVFLNQKVTQQTAGGMTEIYLDSGTYVKSFYSIMYHPSSVQIKNLQVGEKRLHHFITWKNTAPMIIREEHKRG